MELFSKIYSRYYKVAELILEAAGDKGLTEKKSDFSSIFRLIINL